MRKGTAWATALLALPVCVLGQQTPPSATAASPAPAPRTQTPATRITLDEAIRLAHQHNHALQAARTTILQNQSLETTANLRPNPLVSGPPGNAGGRSDSLACPRYDPETFLRTGKPRQIRALR